MKQVEKQIAEIEKEMKKRGTSLSHGSTDKHILKEKFTSK